MKILFLLSLAVYFCYGINVSQKEETKNKIFPVAHAQNDNCLFNCILIPNCKSYEEKNGTCFYTVTWLSKQPITIADSPKANRTKRKKGGFRGVSSARSSSFFSSIFGGGSSYRSSGGGGFFFFFGGYRQHTIGSILFGWFILLLLAAILVCAIFFAILKAKEACFNP